LLHVDDFLVCGTERFQKISKIFVPNSWLEADKKETSSALGLT